MEQLPPQTACPASDAHRRICAAPCRPPSSRWVQHRVPPDARIGRVEDASPDRRAGPRPRSSEAATGLSASLEAARSTWRKAPAADGCTSWLSVAPASEPAVSAGSSTSELGGLNQILCPLNRPLRIFVLSIKVIISDELTADNEKTSPHTHFPCCAQWPGVAVFLTVRASRPSSRPVISSRRGSPSRSWWGRGSGGRCIRWWGASCRGPRRTRRWARCGWGGHDLVMEVPGVGPVEVSAGVGGVVEAVDGDAVGRVDAGGGQAPCLCDQGPPTDRPDRRLRRTVC